MKNPPLILASTSKYRAALLSQLGWEFTTDSPGVDESVLKSQKLKPHDLALELSALKARAVFQKSPHSFVIGSDQVCALEGTILSKPGSKEAAISQLEFMSDKTHQLLTGVTVLSSKGERSFVNITTLTMRKLSSQQIQEYVEADLPLDCAGSYKLESQGIKLFSRIEMEDHTAIIGLPLIQLCSTLLEEGFSL